MNSVRYTAILCLLAALTVEAFGHGLSGMGDEPGRLDDEPITERVQSAAETLLAERFPNFVARLQVRILRVNGSLADEAPLHIRMTSGRGVPRGRTQVRLLTETPDGTTDAGWAMLYIAHYDSVGVAHRDFSSGDAVAAGDVGMAWLDVTTFRGRPLNDEMLQRLQTGESFFTTQPIAAGDAIREGDIRPPYAADTGDAVVLTYQRGPIQMTMSCTARESGVVGEIVRLYSDATQSTYKARLTGLGQAEWVATL